MTPWARAPESRARSASTKTLDSELSTLDSALRRYRSSVAAEPRGGSGSPGVWSAIAGHVGRLARVLHFDEVAPGIRLAAVDVGEAVDARELPAGQGLSVPAEDVGILREGGDGPADESGAFGDGEVGRDLRGVTPVRLGDAVG